MTNPPPKTPLHPNMPDRRAAAAGPDTGPQRDPGSSGAAILAWLIGLAALVGVVVMQQAPAPPPLPAGPGGQLQAAEIAPPATMVEGIHKGVWRVIYLTERAVQQANQRAGTTPDEQEKAITDARTQAGELIAQLEQFGPDPVGETRRRVLRADTMGIKAAEPRWMGLIAELETENPEHPLIADIQTFMALYSDAPPEPDADFLHRHGFFAELADLHGDTDAREALAKPGRTVVLVSIFGVQLLVILLAVLAGFVLLIVGIVLFASGQRRPRFRPPLPGGSVYLETAALFIVSFLVLKLVLDAVVPMMPTVDPLVVTGISQWLLLGVLFWPKLRGAPRAASDLGWEAVPRPTRRGTKRPSVIAEIGAGVVGYLACLPIYIAGVLLALILMAISGLISGGAAGTGADAPAIPENPLFDMVANGSFVGLTLIVLLATVWAPIVEETVFRGALYRHMRARMFWLIAAPITAAVFGAMHGYPIPLLMPVIALGVGFAMLREWRGSIIAAVTAHAIHNGFVFGVLLTAVAIFS